MCYYVSQKVQSNTLPRQKWKTNRSPLPSPLTGGSKGTGTTFTIYVFFLILIDIFLYAESFWFKISLSDIGSFWILPHDTYLLSLNTYMTSTGWCHACCWRVVLLRHIHGIPVCPHHLSLPVDEMGAMMNSIKEGGVSLTGQEQPFTHDHFRRSFIRRCKNPVINEKVHILRTLQSTLKVSADGAGQRLTQWLRHHTDTTVLTFSLHQRKKSCLVVLRNVSL